MFYSLNHLYHPMIEVLVPMINRKFRPYQLAFHWNIFPLDQPNSASLQKTKLFLPMDFWHFPFSVAEFALLFLYKAFKTCWIINAIIKNSLPYITTLFEHIWIKLCSFILNSFSSSNTNEAWFFCIFCKRVHSVFYLRQQILQISWIFLNSVRFNLFS